MTLNVSIKKNALTKLPPRLKLMSNMKVTLVIYVLAIFNRNSRLLKQTDSLITSGNG